MGNEIKKQAIWLLAGTVLAAVLQLVQLGIVARAFDVKQLGILAIVNAVLMVAMVLQDMGMSSYLIHRQTLERKEQSTIFWVNVFFGLATGGLITIIAYPLSLFYNIKELTYLLFLVSANFFILGAMSQYQACFVKTKKLILLAKIEMIAKVLSFLATIFLILAMQFTIAAVIIGQFLNAFFRLFLMLLFSDKNWHPTFQFCGKTFKAAVSYGGYQLGSQTINQLRTQADSFIIGKYLGAEFLGVYSLAKELILQPLKLLTPVINRLTLPRFAETQHAVTELRNLFIRSVSVIVNISAAVYLLIGLGAYIGVRLLYGNEHEEVATLIPYMLLLGVLRPMGGLTGAISQANGSTKKEFIWNVLASLIVVSVVSLSLIAGSITLVAMSLSVAQVIMSITVYPLFIKPVVGVSFKEYLLSWIYTAGFCIIVIVAIDYFNLGMIIFNGITSLFG